MDQIADILSLSDAYCAAAGTAEATLSTRVFGAGSRLAQLRGGASDLGVRRAALAIKWFSDHWPDGARWPESVDRPLPSDLAPGAGDEP